MDVYAGKDGVQRSIAQNRAVAEVFNEAALGDNSLDTPMADLGCHPHGVPSRCA